MEIATIVNHIRESFADVHLVEKDGTTFFFYGPEQMFPFVTIVTRDNEHDSQSRLDRPGAYLLNLGVPRETFGTLFGKADGAFDYSVIDTLFPHPLYGKASWVSIINPSAAHFAEKVSALIAEAYQNDVRKKQRKAAGEKQEEW